MSVPRTASVYAEVFCELCILRREVYESLGHDSQQAGLLREAQAYAGSLLVQELRNADHEQTDEASPLKLRHSRTAAG